MSQIGDIGAGTGNYSQAVAEYGHLIHCIEPSDIMMNQKKTHHNMQWINGYAENIPMKADSMDAVMVILAFHHFKSPKKAIKEMVRVSKGNIVFLTFDPREGETPWIADYFPEIWDAAFDIFPSLFTLKKQIESVTDKQVVSHVLKLPHDLTDYFLAAGWRRPEIYLDPIIRSCMSGFAIANQTKVESSIRELKQDLKSGRWDRQYGHLKKQESLDLGCRFIIAN